MRPRRTHCLRGHDITHPDNYYAYTDDQGREKRQCVRCKYQYHQSRSTSMPRRSPAEAEKEIRNSTTLQIMDLVRKHTMASLSWERAEIEAKIRDLSAQVTE
jgi:hypothetical protein